MAQSVNKKVKKKKKSDFTFKGQDAGRDVAT